MAGLSTITWQTPGRGDANDQFSFLISKDEAQAELMQTGPSPFWTWHPQEPGNYRVQIRFRDGAGHTEESRWSEPYQVVAPRVAVLPFVNLTTVDSAPLEEMRQTLQGLLRGQGLDLLAEEELRAFMKRHWMRSTNGLNSETGPAFLAESGVTGVLITQLTNYKVGSSPRFALNTRLVTASEVPLVVWAKSVILDGDAKRGLLDLALIHDIKQLSDTGLAQVAAALNHFFAEQPGSGKPHLAPRNYYRSPILEQGRPFTVAILPFVNQSRDRFAADLLSLNFLNHLSGAPEFHVLDPGLIEENYLTYRMVLPRGASQDTAKILFSRLDVDLLLSGLVLEYETGGVPRVRFTCQLIHRRDEEIVWTSSSSNDGNEGELLFQQGKIKTANELASRMTRATVRHMLRP
jgi:TolB-like protein